MINFAINPFYLTRQDLITSKEIIEIVEIISSKINTNKLIQSRELILIGVGNDANGEVFSIVGRKFCVKIQKLSKHVGKNQIKQFEIQDNGINSVNGKKYIRDYGGETLVNEMDINGNNLLVNIVEQKLYIIYPYAP